jgi:microcystin-dependent protein
MRKTERRIGLLERRPGGGGGGGGGGSTQIAVQDTPTLDLTLTGTSALGYTIKGDVLPGAVVVDGKTVPAGVTLPWAGTGAVPSGWLLADGSAVSRTLYADLFAAIGTQYGVGDNSTTFNLPNYKGRFVVGQDAAQTEFDVLGENGGTKTHTHQNDHPIGRTGAFISTIDPRDVLQSQAGTTEFVGINALSSTTPVGMTNQSLERFKQTSTASGTLPPYLVQRYIISIGKGGTSSGSRGTVGEMMEWPGAVAPEDFLLCQGQFVSKTTYADLYAIVGDKYLGSATAQAGMFRLPSMSTRVPLGSDPTFPLGSYGGSQTHTLTIAEIPNASGTIGIHGSESGSALWSPSGVFATSPTTPRYRTPTAVIEGASSIQGITFNLGGGGQPHNIMQPYTSLNFIIRYRTTLGVNDTKMAVTDTATIDLTLTGDGSPVTPYTIKADVKPVAPTYLTGEYAVGFTGTIGVDIVTPAKVTLTPGYWLVQAGAGLGTGSSPDTVSCGINAGASVNVVPGTTGPPAITDGAHLANNPVSVVSRQVLIYVASGTADYHCIARRNGASIPILFAGSGGPSAWISAVKVG